jgi:predicted transposase/invertase (TIGR01784 family)
LDLYCISEKGEHFIIEVQQAKQKYFQKRILFYASRLIQEQGIKGKDWDYNFKGVYSIAILDFNIPQNENILNRYRILNEDTYQPLIQDFGIILVDLRKFDKQEQELTSDFEKWLYLLKHLDKLKDIPTKLRQHLFVKLFDLAEYSALNEKQRKEYMESLKKYNDWQNVLDYAHEEGYQEATLKYEAILQQVIKRAEEKDKLLNEEKKRTEQEHQKLLETAKLLLSLGVTVETIMEKTGLTKEEIEKL